VAVPVQTLISHVLVNGLAVYAPGEPIKPQDATTALDAINAVLDDWTAGTQASYAETFLAVVSTGANPEVVGPGGTGAWLMPARPVAIDGVSYDLGGGIYTRIFTTNDPRWWDAQQVSTGATTIGAYYSADEPNGHLYFASPPAGATNVRLMLKTTLGPVLATDVMTLPPGYQSALELTAMEGCADAFHATLTAKQIERAGKARGRIWATNLRIPSLSTRGLGLPGSRGGTWDYRTLTWI